MTKIEAQEALIKTEEICKQTTEFQGYLQGLHDKNTLHCTPEYKNYLEAYENYINIPNEVKTMTKDFPTPETSVASLRVEALKLAYKTATDIKYFKTAYDYEMSDADFTQDLQKVFDLADLNLKYIEGI